MFKTEILAPGVLKIVAPETAGRLNNADGVTGLQDGRAQALRLGEGHQERLS